MTYTDTLNLYKDLTLNIKLSYLANSLVFIVTLVLIVYIVRAIHYLVSKEKQPKKNYRGEVLLHTLMLVVLIPFLIVHHKDTDKYRDEILLKLSEITNEQLANTEVIDITNIREVDKSTGCLFLSEEDKDKTCYAIVVEGGKYLDIKYYLMLSKNDLLTLDKGLSLEVYKPTKEFKEFTEKFPALLDSDKYIHRNEVMYTSILLTLTNGNSKLNLDVNKEYVSVNVHPSVFNETAIQVKKVMKVW